MRQEQRRTDFNRRSRTRLNHQIRAIRRAIASKKPATLVFYEAPHRVIEALQDMDAILGQRQVVVARELTKVHEEFLRGTARDLRSELEKRETIKGEITLLVGKAQQAGEDNMPIEEAVSACIQNGLGRTDAMKAVARQRNISKREVYRRMRDLP